MSDKIRSLLVESGYDLKSKYEQIYRSSDTWLYRKSHGVHSAIVGLVRDRLADAAVLDLGCGAGRLSLMCSQLGAKVDGVDFSETAIAFARLAAEVTRSTHVRFTAESLETFQPGRSYDFVLLIGVLEHVEDPAATLRQARSWLAPGGQLVVSCPNFLNLRGYAYMPLLTLFRMPMSIADAHQISYQHIDAWAADTGLRRARTAGAIYRFGWGAKGVQDLITRVELAARDKGLAPDDLDFAAFNAWLERQAEPGEMFLDTLENQGVLKRIERQVTFATHPVPDAPAGLYDRICQYVSEDVESDPYWSDEPPFCYYGGETIYLLEKDPSR